MADIYSNSFLTIAATASTDNSKSLFSNRWTSFPSPERDGSLVQIPSGSVLFQNATNCIRIRPHLHLAHNRFIGLQNAHEHKTDAPLLTRAWVFQERLLPSRTVHFHSEELVWECRTNMRCECGLLDDPWLRKAESHDQTDPEVPADMGSARWLKSMFTSAFKGHIDHQMLALAWVDLVSEFSRLDLSYESDRLPALSGLAAKFTHTSLGNYFAGMWTASLAICLLYESNQFMSSGETVYKRPSYQPQAPSWSWASIPLTRPKAITYSRIMKSGLDPSADFEIVKLKGRILGKNPFGWVSDAVLTVRGLCVKCSVLRIASNGYWELKRTAPAPGSVQYADLIAMSADGPFAVDNKSELLCLYVGSCLGIILQPVSPIDHVYRRVGLAILPKNSSWPGSMTVQQISIV